MDLWHFYFGRASGTWINPRLEAVLQESVLLERLVVKGHAHIDVPVGIGYTESPLLLCAGLQPVAEGLGADVKIPVGAFHLDVIGGGEDASLAQGRELHHAAVFYLPGDGDKECGDMVAVEHHHAAPIDFGSMHDAVVEGLVAVRAAKFDAHRVTHSAGETVVIGPVPLWRGAHPHYIVARHAAFAGDIVDQRGVAVAAGGAESDAVQPRGEAGDGDCPPGGDGAETFGDNGP